LWAVFAFLGVGFQLFWTFPSYGATNPVPKPAVSEYTALKNDIYHIVSSAIREKEFPGCQVAVVHKGRIVVNEAYGYLTYDSMQEVTQGTLYDLASVTKVAATTLMMMDLYEHNLIRLDETVGCYLPEYDGTEKGNTTIRALLSHNGLLQSYYPFWWTSMKRKLLNPEGREVVTFGQYGHFVNENLRDSVFQWIMESKPARIRGRSQYKYSDLGFMLLQRIAESATGVSMEWYLNERFYQPMGLSHLHFNPSKKGFAYTEIAPTEFDLQFRFRQVWGDVHDRNAAIVGGVAGHAGLFGSAEDLSALLAMMLDSYLGRDESWLSRETLHTFNQSYYEYNRRALGWDKPNDRVSRQVSPSSFGHKGFTGTMVWVDPEYDLAFVFLSNRVYPSRENRKLITNRTRSRIMDVVYEALTRDSTSLTKGVE
jgi:CubicO group peptidase (beta-lactamase class C family)